MHELILYDYPFCHACLPTTRLAHSLSIAGHLVPPSLVACQSGQEFGLALSHLLPQPTTQQLCKENPCSISLSEWSAAGGSRGGQPTMLYIKQQVCTLNSKPSILPRLSIKVTHAALRVTLFDEMSAVFLVVQSVS